MSQLTFENDVNVTTIDGSVELKKNCRKISGEFYRIGDINIENSGHCYWINGKYYKHNTGYIIFDHRLKSYVIKNKASLLYGVVSKENNGNLIYGYFSSNENENFEEVITNDGERLPVLDISIFKDSQYLFNLYRGCYANRTEFKALEFTTPSKVDNRVKNNLPYDSRGRMDELINLHKHYDPTISSQVSKYHKVIGDLSFGLEFETVKGVVPKNISNKLGLMALRDGSVGGLEYATIPLSGKKGLQTLLNGVNALSKYTTYDNSCSLHLHIGNLPRTEEFFIALFKTLYILEDEMYGLFPLYKKYNFGVKRKHYTKPLPKETILKLDRNIEGKKSIKRNFGVIYNFLSMGQNYESAGGSLSKIDYHPSDPGGNSKWNIRSRYHWVNLIPLLFGNKQTIEFRLHTPTYDLQKIMYYLFYCSSIINFVKKNTNAILANPEIISEKSISDIIYQELGSLENSKYNSLADYIYEYLNYRKDKFYTDSRRGEFNGDEDTLVIRKRIDWGNVINNDINYTLIDGNSFKFKVGREWYRNAIEEHLIVGNGDRNRGIELREG